MINPSKPEDYDPNLTEADIFNSRGMTEEEYYNALSISIQTLICTLKDHWIAVLSIIITWLLESRDLLPMWTYNQSLTTINA